MMTSQWTRISVVAVLLAAAPVTVNTATIFIAAGGNLQPALKSAQPGDTILLDEGAEFVGNFVLAVKTGVGWITLRTAATDWYRRPPASAFDGLGPCPDSAHFGHLLRCGHRAGPACLRQLKRTDVVELSRPENRDLRHPNHRSRHENLG